MCDSVWFVFGLLVLLISPVAQTLLCSKLGVKH